MDNYRNNDHQRLPATSVAVRYTGTSKEDRDRDLEKALALFKKILNREGIMQELKDRQYFRSNTEKRRLKQKEAIQRLRAANKKKKSRDSKEYRNDRKDFKR